MPPPQVVGPEIPPPPPPQQPPPDDAPYFPDPQPQDTLLGPGSEGYRFWRGVARVAGKTGWAAMPIAGDDSQTALPCALVKLHAAYSRIVVHYRAIREGSEPQLPDPRPLDANLTLTSWRDQVVVTVGPDGVTPVYHATGRRCYACRTPVFGPITGIPTLRPPWLPAAGISPSRFGQPRL